MIKHEKLGGVSLSGKRTISVGDQIYWGLYGALAASFGVMAKSWSSFFTILLFGLFLFLPSLAARCVRRRWFVTGAGLAAIFVLVLLAGIFSFGERMYYLHGDSYPAWLASGDVGEIGKFPDYLSNPKINNLCGGRGPLAIIGKSGGLVVLRCDDAAFWPNAKTYIGHSVSN